MASMLRCNGVEGRRTVVLVSLVVCLLFVMMGSLVFVSRGAAAEPVSAWWRLGSGSRPTNLLPGGEGVIVASASNLGDAPVQGASAPVTMTDTLPVGMTSVEVVASAGILGAEHDNPAVSCSGSSVVVCTYAGSLLSYERLEVKIHVRIGAGVESGAINRVS